MTPDDIAPHLDGLRGRFEELQKALTAPDLYADPENARRITSEHRRLVTMFREFDDWKRALSDIESSKALAAAEEDADMRALAEEDILSQQNLAEKLEKSLQIALLPPDPNDDRNIIVEIKPAAGGEEAALFAGELSRAYLKYAESRNWRVEILDQSFSDLGGIKNQTFSLTGSDVYSRMKFESGVHRVQRVPETEAGGRIHTSTVTVSVMPEAAEVELDVRQEDLRFDVFRSSGPGGQCVNTTDSAVRVAHFPSGLSVASQQEKSQHRNKGIALRILYARLLEIKQREEQSRFAADKRSQVGTGDRSERIRTYNFPQNRVTDHRFGVNIHELPAVVEGDLDQVIEPILLIECERRLEALRK